MFPPSVIIFVRRVFRTEFVIPHLPSISIFSFHPYFGFSFSCASRPVAKGSFNTRPPFWSVTAPVFPPADVVLPGDTRLAERSLGCPVLYKIDHQFIYIEFLKNKMSGLFPSSKSYFFTFQTHTLEFVPLPQGAEATTLLSRLDEEHRARSLQETHALTSKLLSAIFSQPCFSMAIFHDFPPLGLFFCFQNITLIVASTVSFIIHFHSTQIILTASHT